MNRFASALKKYPDFSGPAQRSEYWYFNLFSLAVLIASISVSVRGLQDTFRSGWWLRIGFVPQIGAIILLVSCVQDSQVGSNRFGPKPKAPT